jgi:hypothetical protein
MKNRWNEEKGNTRQENPEEARKEEFKKIE